MPSRRTTLKRSLAALCLVLLVSATAAAEDKTSEAPICSEDLNAVGEANRELEKTEPGSLLNRLALKRTEQAFLSLFRCIAQSKGLCGSVGQLLLDRAVKLEERGGLLKGKVPGKTERERKELTEAFISCLETGKPGR